MQDGWIPLECTDCGTELEYSPADLPPTGNEFTCENCQSTRPVAEFVQTQEGLEMLEEFHA